MWAVTTKKRTTMFDAGLALAAWSVVTLSMAAHAFLLGVALIILGANADDATSYTLILNWAPLWSWGVTIVLLSSLWVIYKGLVRIVVGILITAWFWALSSAFIIAWVNQDVHGTSITAWLTYGFIGWLWMCITYVVWKDTSDIEKEISNSEPLSRSVADVYLE